MAGTRQHSRAVDQSLASAVLRLPSVLSARLAQTLPDLLSSAPTLPIPHLHDRALRGRTL